MTSPDRTAGVSPGAKLVARVLAACGLCTLLATADPDPASAGSLFDDWRLEAAVGYAHAEGGMSSTLGGGFGAGLALGRRIGSVVVESGFFASSVSDAAGATVMATVCTPTDRGPLACAPQQTRQRADDATLRVGIAVPLWVKNGRSLQVGAGGLVGNLTVGPGGGSLGSRRSRGVYAAFSAEVLPIGRVAAVGAMVRGSWASSDGAPLGAGFPSRTHDARLDLNLVLRIGARPGEK